MVGGVLGVLMMIPLRRSLIVQEHANLPYPEGTACASVLIAGEKGGNLARTAYIGLAVAAVYAVLQRILHVIAETPALALKRRTVTCRRRPSAARSRPNTSASATSSVRASPGVLVAGGVLAWLGLIPLITVLTPPDAIAAQLIKLGYLASIGTPGGPGAGIRRRTLFANTALAVYRAYVRQIGAGAVAAGGFITLLKTLPTIVSSFKESIASLRRRAAGGGEVRAPSATCRSRVVLVGSLVLILVIAVLAVRPRRGHREQAPARPTHRRIRLLLRDRREPHRRPHRVVVEPDLGHDDRDADGDLPGVHRPRLDGRRLPTDGAVRRARSSASRPPTRARRRRISRPASWSARRRARSRSACSSASSPSTIVVGLTIRLLDQPAGHLAARIGPTSTRPRRRP